MDTNNCRAYSLLEVNAYDDEKREITGMATTPEPDRYGDVVEPLGAKFAGELPLLWQHRHDSPVGVVRFGKPTKSGIPFTASVAKLENEGQLKAMVDMAWDAVKAKLVRGVSIGFRALEYTFMDTGGIRFTEVEIYELSLVTIPANASATIQSIKAMDTAGRKHVASCGVPLVKIETHSAKLEGGAVGLVGKAKKPKDKDYNAQDVSFVRDMIEHHEMAVEMSSKQTDKGKNEEIIALAKQIAKAQKGEISQMKKWLKDRDLSESGGGGGNM